MGRKQQSSSSSSSSSSFWHSRRRSTSAPATPRASAADPPLGCMSMVHYLIFAPGAGCVGRPPTSCNAGVVAPPHNNNYHHGEEAKKEKRGGLEAPRNSLDLDADNLNDIPIGVQIEPVFDALACRKMRSKATAPSSEAETPRTPSLVARLMGIDGLPEREKNNSPAQSMKKKEEKKKRVIPESMNRREPLRSLSCNVVVEETTSARASWDGARLSLQALKENVLERAAQYMSLPTSPTSGSGKKKKSSNRRVRREEDKERTAKEILRQAKEAVTNRKQRQQQRSSPTDTNKENVSPVPAPVPRKDKLLPLLVQERKHQTVVVPSPANKEKRVALSPKNPPQRAKPSRPPPPPPPLDTRARKKPDGCERFATRIKKPAAAAAAGSSGTGCLPPARSSSPLSKLEKEQEKEDPEYRYLRMVLERGGPRNSSNNHRWFIHNAASPIDPIVFHLLELDLPADDEEARLLGPLRHRWNRKLMFHLAQEILLAHAPVPRGGDAGPQDLLSRVWKTVRSFPAADCRVVGDIDALVAADLRSPASVRRLERHPAVAEEADDVAEELADQVLDCLIMESLSLSSDVRQTQRGS